MADDNVQFYHLSAKVKIIASMDLEHKDSVARRLPDLGPLCAALIFDEISRKGRAKVPPIMPTDEPT